jgi:hypothetical protein
MSDNKRGVVAGQAGEPGVQKVLAMLDGELQNGPNRASKLVSLLL